MGRFARRGGDAGVPRRSVTRQNRCGVVALSSVSSCSDRVEGGDMNSTGVLLERDVGVTGGVALPWAGVLGTGEALAAGTVAARLLLLTAARVLYKRYSTVNELLAGGSPGSSQF
jgi:hypothetical protein